MSGFLGRLRRAAEARADAVRAEVKAKLSRAMPGVTVREEGDRIEISAPNITDRWLAEDDLRNLRDGDP